MKTENASMARTFRFTPDEWTAIETALLPDRSSAFRRAGVVALSVGHLTQGVIDHTGSDLWQAAAFDGCWN